MKPLFIETIKLGEVEAAQEAWCDALVAISRAHAKGGLDQSKPLAGQVIDGPMAINMVQSLSSQLGLSVKQPSVKPVREQFHISSEITQPLTILAPLGTPGPKRSPWVICRPEIAVIQIFGNTANAMGWVHIEAADGKRSKVDKTFGYVRDDDGTLRIVVCHSLSPFSGY